MQLPEQLSTHLTNFRNGEWTRLLAYLPLLSSLTLLLLCHFLVFEFWLESRMDRNLPLNNAHKQYSMNDLSSTSCSLLTARWLAVLSLSSGRVATNRNTDSIQTIVTYWKWKTTFLWHWYFCKVSNQIWGRNTKLRKHYCTRTTMIRTAFSTKCHRGALPLRQLIRKTAENTKLYGSQTHGVHIAVTVCNGLYFAIDSNLLIIAMEL